MAATRERFAVNAKRRICAGKKERRKIALVALAHKLVRVVSGMLRSGEAWREAPATPDPTRQPTAMAVSG